MNFLQKRIGKGQTISSKQDQEQSSPISSNSGKQLYSRSPSVMHEFIGNNDTISDQNFLRQGSFTNGTISLKTPQQTNINQKQKILPKTETKQQRRMSGTDRRKQFRKKGNSRSMEKIEIKEEEQQAQNLFIQPKFISPFILPMIKNPTRMGLTQKFDQSNDNFQPNPFLLSSNFSDLFQKNQFLKDQFSNIAGQLGDDDKLQNTPSSIDDNFYYSNQLESNRKIDHNPLIYPQKKISYNTSYLNNRLFSQQNNQDESELMSPISQGMDKNIGMFSNTVNKDLHKFKTKNRRSSYNKSNNENQRNQSQKIDSFKQLSGIIRSETFQKDNSNKDSIAYISTQKNELNDWQYQRDQIALKFYREQNKKLDLNLRSTKIFLNMVIHDLRNPTSQINFGIGFALEILDTALKQQLDEAFTNQKNNLLQIISNKAQDLIKIFEKLQNEIQDLKQVNIEQKGKLEFYKKESLQKQIQIDQFKVMVDDLQHQLLEQEKQINQSNQLQSKIYENSKIENYIQKIKQNQKQNYESKINSFDSPKSASQSSSEDCDDAGSDQNLSQPMKKQLKQQYGILFTGQSPNEIGKKSQPGKVFQKQNKDPLCNQNDQNQSRKFINSSFKIKKGQQLIEDHFQQKSKNNSQNLQNFIQSSNDIQHIERNQQNRKHNKKNSSLSDFTFNNQNLLSAIVPEIGLNEGSENSSLSADLNSFENASKQTNRNVKEILIEFQEQLKGQIQSYSHQLQIEEAIEMIQGCRHSSTMLLNLLNDLLDLAKQEKLTFQLNKSYFNLIETIRASFKTLEFLSMNKQVKLNLIVSPNQEKFFENIYGDEKRYEQILLNFLSNALKFTPSEGKVDVVLQIQNVFSAQNRKELISKQKWHNPDTKKIIMQIMDEYQEFQIENEKLQSTSSHYDLNFGNSLLKNNQMLRTPSINQEITNKQDLFFIQFSLKIIDTGQGISEEGLKNLFLDFSSLKEHSHINQRGTGLGLSICKKIINKMGGKVHVRSQKDVGTTFKIEITTLSQVFGGEYDSISGNSMSSRSAPSKSINIQSIEQKYLNSNKKNNEEQKSDKSKKSSNNNSTISNQLKSDQINDNISNNTDQNNVQNNSSIKRTIKNKNQVSCKTLNFKQLDDFGDIQKFESNKQTKINLQISNLVQKVHENLSSFGNTSLDSVLSDSQDSSDQIHLTDTKYDDDQINQQMNTSQPILSFNELQTFKQTSKDTGSFNRHDSDLNYQGSLFDQKSKEEFIKQTNKIQEDADKLSNKSLESSQNVTLKINQQLQKITESSSEMKLNDEQKTESDIESNEQNQNQASYLRIENALSFGELDNASSKQSTMTLCNENEPRQISKQVFQKVNPHEELKQFEFDKQSDLYQNNLNYMDGFYQNMVDYCFLEIERQKKWTNDLKLLLVNDDQMTLMILHRIFTTKIGFNPDNIDQAYDGLEAQKKAQIKSYDLIVMDLNMPVMDGFTATQNIKNFYSKNSQQMFASSIILQNSQSPYIIALSGSQYDQQLLNQCQEAGFDDYFTQPLTVDDIFQKILSKIYYIHQIIANDQIARIEQEKAIKAQQAQRKNENKSQLVSVPSIKQILSKRFDVIEEEASEDEEQPHYPLLIKPDH